MSLAASFLALQPDPELTEFLRHAKDRVLTLAGEQLYRSDPPHLTVYLAYFADLSQVETRLRALASDWSPFSGNLRGWHVFENDPLTTRNTLVCQIDSDALPMLRSLQSAVIDAIAPLRNHLATHARYANRWNALTPERQSAVESVGFPFIGNDWLPHFSVASILPNDWPPVWEALRGTPPPSQFHIAQLKLYRLDGLTPIELATIPLGG
ncbi:2'-5' RNA ligase family protein [Tuwongella immobilis]|uniref:2'-5' RNA ligase family protein n=1 Tax=Tuwongella immobilis TaxID=692036 RepID=A0A6C2YQ81_9BACT|nr:2'-5' RNA ligase family protein [Tuwongella immobilis]VIP03790.1 Uncharacterized protein OS=Blastopirellula marina DSM 3645 GN=DSM3645_13333 PE=4 SV=1: 2_5_RNA_ligase2 [Tuwongella immobilis]VTS04947.1 Uncharacterized protein OS=Blastopirellula marina DSM 3645 GN=DSM3645_13333 PE=4 SV=1: 2_5_RNA_ligase2 [Tuwongella immobilis]